MKILFQDNDNNSIIQEDNQLIAKHKDGINMLVSSIEDAIGFLELDLQDLEIEELKKAAANGLD